MSRDRNSLMCKRNGYRAMVVVLLILGTLILSPFMVLDGKSAPVIINTDSWGSWSDTFTDATGVEEFHNTSVISGNVTLINVFNGTNWTKQGVAVPNGDIYDLHYAKSPCVLKDGMTYKIWYAGYNNTDNRVRILYATSSDGIIWTKSSFNPVLDKGNPGDDDDEQVDSPKVIKDGGTYKMWYAGNDGSTNRIMYATSFDGINWTKQGTVLTGSNVFPNSVIKDGGMYKLWYQDLVGGNYRIYYANSTDGIVWTKQGMALNIGSSGQLDDLHVTGAAVLKVNEVLYRMWYSGHDGSTGYRIFYAESEDEINWVRQGLALDQGGPGDKDDDGAAYPCIIKDDDGFHKIYYGGVVGGLDMSILWATSPSTPENCNLTSKKISLPSGQTWGRLRINKTEFGQDNYINISILDGETNETIFGFENLNGADIDLSSIDYIAHPIIRLFANFDVNESEMPLLHEWEVIWEDTIAPDTPSGFAVNNPFTGFSLIISWDPNFEEDLTTYVLYYSTDNTTFYRLTNLSSNTVYYIHYGRVLNQTYYYKVAAADEVPNESPPSVVLEGVPDLDFDGDGIGNTKDTDDDNDGIPDLSDSYPLNPFNDIEITIDNIELILEDLNVTELLDAMDYLNQTLPPQVDALREIMENLTDLNITDIMAYLEGLNSTLYTEIQNLLNSITNDIIDINNSLSYQLTDLLNNMNNDHDALRTWLDIVLTELGTNISTTNETLQKQLSALNASAVSFFNDLDTDLNDIITDLQSHDITTGQDHSDIINALDDLLAQQPLDINIDELKSMLSSLNGNISFHNQSIANDIQSILDEINSYKATTDGRLGEINDTLDHLILLENILGDLDKLNRSLNEASQELNDSLDDMNEDLQDSIDEIPSQKEDEIGLTEILLIVIVVLLVINLLLTLLGGKRIKQDTKDETQQDEIPKPIEPMSPPPPPLD